MLLFSSTSMMPLCSGSMASYGALNLQMEGLSPSPKLFKELMRRWSGFTLTGGLELLNEPERKARLMNPKGYVRL